MVTKVVPALVVAIAVLAMPFDSSASPGTTTRISVDSLGNQGNEQSCCPVISGDGNVVAFYSFASNLVAADTNGQYDVFARNRQTAVTERVSIPTGGGEANKGSAWPAINGDGRFVAFLSAASNLVPVDTNNSCDYDGNTVPENCVDVFVRDRLGATTTRVSVATGGGQAIYDSGEPAISADGRFVAFSSYSSNLVGGDTHSCADFGYPYNCSDVFVHDRQTGVTERVSISSDEVQSNGDSYLPSVSGDGHYVAYYSVASNLVTGDTNNSCDNNGDSVYAENCADVFIRDRFAGTTTRVSIATGGGQGNSDSSGPVITADGRYVVFYSLASNLVAGDTNNLCDVNADNVFIDNCRDVFLHDRVMAVTERVSLDNGGGQGNNRSGGTFHGVDLSGDGRYVSFHSQASNLVPGDTSLCDLNGDTIAGEECIDVFVRDRTIGTTVRISVDSSGTQGNGHTASPAMSASGRVVAFDSTASNLVPNDTNLCQMDADPGLENCYDAFAHDLGDSDVDGVLDPFDVNTNSDGDSLSDLVENRCGSNPSNGASLPERIDTPGDDDGDTFVNEALPPGAETYDCDGDGYKGSAEAHVTTSDQDPCGGSGWPSDIIPGGIQPNTLNIADIGSFIVPVRRVGTSVGDPGFNARWDLVPGAAIGEHIAVTDIAATVVGTSGFPPMFGGLRAYGKTCPWAP